MSDTPPPLPAPTPDKKEISDVVKVAVIFLIFAVVLSVTAIAMYGGKNESVMQVTQPAAAVETPVQSSNKYDDYYEHVLSNSGQAQTTSKSDVIELGDLVCGALDKGNTFSAVTSTLSDVADGQTDTEYYAAVVTGAVKYICPEYFSALESYLNN